MHRISRWVSYAAWVVAGIFVAAAAVLYVASERVLRREYAVPRHDVVVQTDLASIAEGRRLAITHGCYQGCHGKGLEGAAFVEERWVARLVAPNLTRSVRRYSDRELEGIIRHGVRPDGRSVFVMPSEAFAALSDVELGNILAFLHSESEVLGPIDGRSFGPLGRLGLLRGDFIAAPTLIPHDIIESHPALPPSKDTLAFGRYLARSICTECHGVNLQGDASIGSPGLAVVAAYSREDFDRLLRTGISVSGRELGLMRSVALSRFDLLTDEEVQALYSYLRTLHGTGVLTTER